MSAFQLLEPGVDVREAVVLEADYGPPHPHHLPGAVRVHPSVLEAGHYPLYRCPADGNLLPDGALGEALAGIGVAPDARVVVYGRGRDGTMAAARLAWALWYAGVARVGLLDGGIEAWRGAVTAHAARPRPVARAAWRVRRELLATTADVRAGGAPLVDVRERGEWSGCDRHHYPFFATAGHIPGAVHQGDWDNLVDEATGRIGPRLRATARRWRRLGILDAPPIFYCGTGWRSSVAVLVAHLLGVPARNYDDGFYGWSRDANNAIARDDAVRRPA